MTWTATRLKHLCTDAGQYGLNVSATDYHDEGIRLIRTSDISDNGGLRESKQGVFLQLKLDQRFLLQDGDILLSRSGTLGRSMMVPPLVADLTFAGYLIRFRPNSDVDPRFLRYCAASAPFQAAIESDAVESTILNFNAERYANISVLTPSLIEQRRIADFLDTETARINEIVTLRGLQIELLAELRRARVEIGISSVTSIGMKLIRLVKLLRDGSHQPPPRVDTGVPLLTARNVSSGVLQLTPHDTHVSIEDADLMERSFKVRANDVLISVKGTIGAIAIVPEGFPRVVLDRNVAILRTHSNIVTSDWLAFALSTSEVQEQMRLAVYAAAQPGLPLGVIAGLQIKIPALHVQRTVANRLNSEIAEIDLVKDVAQRQADVFVERRQALITAAVTGQFDVTTGRGADLS